VPVLRTFEVWPLTGPVGKPWHDDPDVDAFARTSRGVCELFGEALVPAGLRSHTTVLRLTVSADGPADEVEVAVVARISDGPEQGSVVLPRGFARLPADVRRAVVLDVLTAAAGRLAEARGWPREAVDVARRHVEAAGGVYRMPGAWKTSPDRRYRARAVVRLADDGFARIALEVTTRDGVEPLAVSAEVPGTGTADGLRRSVRSLRWTGPDAAEVLPWTADGPGEPLRLVVPVGGRPAARPRTAAVRHPSGAHLRRPVVRVADSPEQPWLTVELVLARGTYMAVFPPFADEVARVAGILAADPAWQRWWRNTSKAPALEVLLILGRLPMTAVQLAHVEPEEVRRGRRRHRVTAHVDSAGLDLLSHDERDAAALPTLLAAVDRATAALRLAPRPEEPPEQLRPAHGPALLLRGRWLRDHQVVTAPTPQPG
jgi:hypothetical protein